MRNRELQSVVRRSFTAPEVPDYVLADILARIDRERNIIARRRAVFFATNFLVSLGVLILVIQLSYSHLSQSGFSQYLSLIFSDADIVIAYWQSFIYSLVETLPIFYLILTFGFFAFFLYSLRMFALYSQALFHPSRRFLFAAK